MEHRADEIRRTLSEFSGGGAVNNPVELLQRTARLYYNSEGQMGEIKRHLSAPAGSVAAKKLNSVQERVRTNGTKSAASGENGIDMPDGMYEDDVVDGPCGEPENMHNGAQELEVPFDNPRDFLRQASVQFFAEEEDSDEDCDKCDGGVDDVDFPIFWPKAYPRTLLSDSEKLVMKRFEDKLEAFDVDIGGAAIHTVRICVNPNLCKKLCRTPLVMVHGIGGAIPAFYKNYQHLANERCVYGIDMPGFGLSARVEFPDDPEGCESKMVEMMERWRKEMKIEKMILLGHSFGGYVSALYALKYPDQVQHLILLDPWGMFSEKDDGGKTSTKLIERIAKKMCSYMKIDPFSKFESLGDFLAKRILGLFMKKEVQEMYGKTCMDYLIRLATTGKQTGTKAFTVISNYTFTYPETPLKDRLIKLLSRNDINLQLTLIYGANSDFYEKGRHNASEVVNRFPRNASLHCVEEADHHVQVQNPEEMQKYITRNAFSSNQNGSCYGNGHQHIHRHNSTI